LTSGHFLFDHGIRESLLYFGMARVDSAGHASKKFLNLGLSFAHVSFLSYLFGTQQVHGVALYFRRASSRLARALT
jgi:hypothetical protein